MFGPTDHARSVPVHRSRRGARASLVRALVAGGVSLITGGALSLAGLAWVAFELGSHLWPMRYPALRVSPTGLRIGARQEVPWADVVRMTIDSTQEVPVLTVHNRSSLRPDEAPQEKTLEELEIAPHQLRELMLTYSGRDIPIEVREPDEGDVHEPVALVTASSGTGFSPFGSPAD